MSEQSKTSRTQQIILGCVVGLVVILGLASGFSEDPDTKRSTYSSQSSQF